MATKTISVRIAGKKGKVDMFLCALTREAPWNWV